MTMPPAGTSHGANLEAMASTTVMTSKVNATVMID
jgi:hypothetical protein